MNFWFVYIPSKTKGSTWKTFLLFSYRQSVDLLSLLRNKREHLQDIDASIEKCLMLNRWIKYIEEVTHRLTDFSILSKAFFPSKNQQHAMVLIGKIQEEMNNQMVDNRTNQMINYPEASMAWIPLMILTCRLCRIFANENETSNGGLILKGSDGFSTIVWTKHKHQT